MVSSGRYRDIQVYRCTPIEEHHATNRVHAGYSTTWGAGGTLRTGQGIVHRYLVAKLDTTDCGVRKRLTTELKATNTKSSCNISIKSRNSEIADNGTDIKPCTLKGYQKPAKKMDFQRRELPSTRTGCSRWYRNKLNILYSVNPFCNEIDNCAEEQSIYINTLFHCLSVCPCIHCKLMSQLFFLYIAVSSLSEALFDMTFYREISRLHKITVLNYPTRTQKPKTSTSSRQIV